MCDKSEVSNKPRVKPAKANWKLDSYVWGSQNVSGFAEVKKAILGANVHLTHQSYSTFSTKPLLSKKIDSWDKWN